MDAPSVDSQQSRPIALAHTQRSQKLLDQDHLKEPTLISVLTLWNCVNVCAPEGIRTPNLLIRSQMLYPLSYGRE